MPTHSGSWTPEPPDYRRVVLVSSALRVMTLVFAGFILINLLYVELPSVALLDALARVLGLAVYLRFRHSRRLNEAA